MSIVRNSSIIGLLDCLLIPAGLLGSILITRILGPSGAGFVSISMATVGVLITLGSFGFKESTVYFYKARIFDISSIIPSRIVVTLVYCFLIMLIFIFFRNHTINIFFEGVDKKLFDSFFYVTIFCLLLSGLLMDDLLAVLVVDGDITLYSILRSIVSFSKLLLFFLMLAIFNMGVIGALLSYLLVYISHIVIFLTWSTKNSFRISLVPSKKIVCELFRTGFRQYGMSLLTMVPKQLDFFLISFFMDIKYVGFYFVAFVFMNLIYEIPRITVWPLVGRMTRVSEEERGRKIAQAIRIHLFFMSILSLIAIIAAPYIIYYIYGEIYMQSLSAARIVLVSATLGGINLPASAYYNSIGKPGNLLLQAVCGILIHFVIGIIFVPVIGIVGAAIGFFSSQLFMGGSYLVDLSKRTGFSWVNFLIITKEDLSEFIKHIRKITFFQRMVLWKKNSASC